MALRIFWATASVLMSAMRRSWEWHFSQTISNQTRYLDTEKWAKIPPAEQLAMIDRCVAALAREHSGRLAVAGSLGPGRGHGDGDGRDRRFLR
jgi:hypothetical protein